MSNTVALRSGKDRLRYTITFEVSLMMLLIPAGAAFFDKGIADIGLLGLVLSLKAMLISLLYNWCYDKFDARRGRISSDRSPLRRILHAGGFEFSLLLTSLPVYCWWLNLTITEAVMADLIVTTFVVAYTYVFTLGYDRTFPVMSHNGSSTD